jgi:hypothetical protein
MAKICYLNQKASKVDLKLNYFKPYAHLFKTIGMAMRS